MVGYFYRALFRFSLLLNPPRLAAKTEARASYDHQGMNRLLQIERGEWSERGVYENSFPAPIW